MWKCGEMKIPSGYVEEKRNNYQSFCESRMAVFLPLFCFRRALGEETFEQ